LTDAFLERVATAIRGRYALIRELGQGGMGAVYLARDLKLGREVAIKVLLPHVRAALGPERFHREVEVVSKLSHPNIIKLFEADEVDGIAFYVMDYVEGESLQQRLEREGPIGLKDALHIAAEVGDALQYAHEHRIIHRDIKPGNILLLRGHALVADFGVAKNTMSEGGTLTSEGVAVGTAPYMSPEQAGGEKKVDGRSDVYSLAAVLYEMLVGEAPFTGKSVQAIIARVMADPPRPIRTTRSTVPAQVEMAILEALAKTPADRPSSAQEFVTRITAAVTERPLLLRPAALAAVLVMIVLGSGGWIIWKLFATHPPASMVLVPGASFRLFGGTCSQCLPERTVALDSFYIDRTEVPVGEYAKYVAAGRAPAPWNVQPADSLPVTGVFWLEADGFCRWREARLPTEEQWEAAARGPGGRLYPWGPTWEEGRANADNSALALKPVGSSAAGDPPSGVADLIGNAWEWTASVIQSRHVIRGGAYNSPRSVATAVYRTSLPAAVPESLRQSNYGNTGFRCVRTIR
jgi:formylglycine-generating enzyme required for sulfatase activity